MGRKSIDPGGGERVHVVATRMPHAMHSRLLAAVSRQAGLTVAEFMRRAAEAEMVRLDADTGPPGKAA